MRAVPVEGRQGDRLLMSNTAALFAGRCVTAALGWAGTLLVVRSLSVDAFGRFSFVFSLLGLVSVFSELGLGRVAIRGLVDDGTDRRAFAGSLLVLRGLLGLVSYGAAFAFVTLAGYPSDVVVATAVAGIVVLLATPAHAVEGVFQAHLRLGTVAVGNVIGQLAQFGVIAAIAVGGGGMIAFVVPAVVGEAVVLGWRLYRVRVLQGLRPNVNWSQWRDLLVEALPLAAGNVLAVFMYRVDSIMLSRLDTFDAVAVYGVAYKFVDLVHFLPAAIMASLLAMMVRAWPADPEDFARIFRRGFSLLAFATIFIAVQFTLFAEPLIGLLYGTDYAAGHEAAKVVVIAECIGAFGVLAFTTLVALGQHRVYPLATMLGLTTNVGLNLWLIPIASYHGAAWATLVTEVLVVAILMRAVLGPGWLGPLPWSTLAAYGAAAAVGVGCAAAVWQVAPWPLAAMCAAAAQLGALRLLAGRPANWFKLDAAARPEPTPEGAGR